MQFKDYKYYIDSKTYRIEANERYIGIRGWCFYKDGADVKYDVEINGEKREFTYKAIERIDVQERYQKYNVSEKIGFHMKVYLSDDENIKTFRLFIIDGKEKHCIAFFNSKAINSMLNDKTILYNIDGITIDSKFITINGWATIAYDDEDKIHFLVKDRDNHDQRIKIEETSREDLYLSGLINENQIKCGFHIKFVYDQDNCYKLLLADHKNTYEEEMEPSRLWEKQKLEARKGFLRKVIRYSSLKNVKKILLYILNNGFSGLKEYIVTRVNSMGIYSEWFRRQLLSEEELTKQREMKFKNAPKISIIVPTYNTPDEFLREMIDSVKAQSYENWELCIADGSGGNTQLENIIKEYANADGRIKYRFLEKNMGISGNTNMALELASGEYIGLLDHDDALATNALYEIISALQEDDYDILYTDEDKVSADLKIHFDPNFKPDFSMDLFCSHNYITHFFVVKSEIMNKVGGFRSEYDGSQDYDVMFRCIENSDKIKHIPKILYYWRVHDASVAGDPASKMYAYDAGKKAIEDHFKRVGVKASVELLDLWGMYHVIYETPGNPLVSIIIPNKDHTEDLERCITSIINKSSYKNIEFIIIENNSEEEKTFSYYKHIEQTYENIRVIKWEEEFNYSLINNFGVQYANGEYLLFLNNDTEMITENAISELLGCCMREDVGAVGAKLLYEDNTVQHAGVVIGFAGYAGHVFHGIDKNGYGYMVRARVNCNYSAVTAACMMTKRTLFEQVGGFDARFKVACNDVDYCLKIRELDKWVVCNAFSHWYHYESKSRGYEDSIEKLERFESEVKEFQKKWAGILKEGDPFYNKNFPVTQAPFTLELTDNN